MELLLPDDSLTLAMKVDSEGSLTLRHSLHIQGAGGPKHTV